MRARAQRGVALLTALLVMAVAVASIVPALTDERVAVARNARLLDLAQARHAGLGVERWAGAVLLRDAADSDSDHLGEDWARPVPAVGFERGSAGGGLADLQARFNLNNLLRDGQPEPLWVARFQRLLSALSLDPDLAAALLDWMDADERPRLPGGAEALDYLARDPPYRAANRPLSVLSELYLVAGFDAATVARLAPFVSVLPGGSSINVNTAAPEVLQALAAAPGPASARSFVAERERTPLADFEALRAAPLFATPGAELDGLGVGSDWFELDVRLQVGAVQLRQRAVLRRDGSQVHTVRRSEAPP